MAKIGPVSVLALLSLLPMCSFADGCDVKTVDVSSDISPNIGPGNYYQVTGYCSSSTAALEGCNAVAATHGYAAVNGAACFVGEVGELDLWSVGWLYEYATGGPNGNGVYPPFYLLEFYFPQFFVSTDPRAQCDICVGDPINPANGSAFAVQSDFPARHQEALPFNRFYNSSRVGGADLSVSWQHGFSRHVQPLFSTIRYKDHTQKNGSIDSSLYPNAATACTSGFAQISSQVKTWANGVAVYSNGVCSIVVNGVTVGILPIYSNVTAPFGTAAIVGLNVTRDDGQLLAFMINGTSIVGPASVALKLQQTSSGYSVTDESDSIEAYDINGVLQSITSRAGVVQTMNYDGSGRLSVVTDSLGHRLTFGYDAQNRLISVTRQ